ncbi:MAG: hypothetical protein AB7L13_13145 [Acidimicrobiia bacterium]
MRIPDNKLLWKGAVGVIGLLASVIALVAFGQELFGETDTEATRRTVDDIRSGQDDLAVDIDQILEAVSAGNQQVGFTRVARSQSGDAQIAIVVSPALPGTKWATTPMFVAPGAEVRVLVTLQNEGKAVLRDVILGAVVKDGIAYVPGTTKLYNGNHPDGIALSSDNIASGGITLGSYPPSGWSYITLTLRVTDSGWSCGTHGANVRFVTKAVNDDTGGELPIAVSAPLLSVERVCA